MLIRPLILTIESPCLDFVFSLLVVWFLGAPRNNLLSQDRVLKQNIGDSLLWLHKWYGSLLSDICITMSHPLILWCDNLSVVHLSVNPILHSKIKHVELDIYFFHDLVFKKKITVRHLPTTEQIVDVLTRPLSATNFLKLKKKLTVVPATNISL